MPSTKPLPALLRRAILARRKLHSKRQKVAFSGDGEKRCATNKTKVPKVNCAKHGFKEARICLDRQLPPRARSTSKSEKARSIRDTKKVVESRTMLQASSLQADQDARPQNDNMPPSGGPTRMDVERVLHILDQSRKKLPGGRYRGMELPLLTIQNDIDFISHSSNID